METMAVVESKSTETALPGDYFSEDHLARELDVTKKTLHRWDKQGRGPKRSKIGRRVVYRRDSVREWLAACERDHHQRDRRFGARANRARMKA